MSHDSNEYKADLPEETHETFDDLVGQGVEPSSAAATIAWLTLDVSQPEAAELFGSSVSAIKRHRDAVADALGVDVADAWQPGGREDVRSTAVRRIVDVLGLEEETHYTRHSDGYGGEEVALLAEGLEQVANAIEEQRSERSEGDAP